VIGEAGFGRRSTIYDIEDLREERLGVIRRRGINTTCPIDGRKGAAYVHCLTGEDNVGLPTHMLSYLQLGVSHSDWNFQDYCADPFCPLLFGNSLFIKATK
jgi:hypothetical protein